MKVALVLGSASTVWDDAEAAWEYQPKVIVACNEIGVSWADRLDVWCTLHPEKMERWREERAARSHPPAGEHIGHTQWPGVDRTVCHLWPGQNTSASSGGYAAKIALEFADHVILAGVPLTPLPHFNRDLGWQDFASYRTGWEQSLPHIEGRVSSMSGWTRELLGHPSNYLKSA